MNKQPAIQFYIGDWKKDPYLSMCSPATRGIWIDLLCAMHENNRSGVIEGTVEQLSRICRCNIEEMRKSLEELNITKTANVTYCNNAVQIINRRMNKEYIIRKSTKERVYKHRQKEETKKKEGCNTDATNSTSSSPSITNNYIHIFDFWNEQKIIVHRKCSNSTKRKIITTLKEYSEDEIKEAIKNYSIVIKSDKHVFDYEWILEDFLSRGLKNFLSEAKPMTKYKWNKNNQPESTGYEGRNVI